MYDSDEAKPDRLAVHELLGVGKLKRSRSQSDRSDTVSMLQQESSSFEDATNIWGNVGTRNTIPDKQDKLLVLADKVAADR